MVMGLSFPRESLVNGAARDLHTFSKRAITMVEYLAHSHQIQPVTPCNVLGGALHGQRFETV